MSPTNALQVELVDPPLHLRRQFLCDRSENKPRSSTERIVISFVVCDSRFNESLNVIKSVLLFTKTPVYFVIFTDNKLRAKFNETLNDWKTVVKCQFDFELHKINFPGAYEEDWINLFSKCAAQRLFIPKLIPHIDSMIYVDTDTLFLGPVDELWDAFGKFNESQISAMTLEDDNPNVSWYPRFAKHPFYGKYGLNSGVMLMNLTRMRDFGWVDYVTPIMLRWKLYIPWGDQDIINIIFHYHESAVYVLSCRYNYRSDQCMYGDACADATKKGVFVLHGSRKAFHNHKQPALEAVYKAIDEYEIGTDPVNVFTNMEKYLNKGPQSHCGNLKDAFLKVPKQILKPKHTISDT
ncbi:glucoside xylosyltransferase 1-like [Melitaea cinxia]|uniref:glucoside xylosyltransferase 1-like n=1 Tax=Melitaea cinxia TaxID=113334 RepID=UPI001E272E69|nr:glucoside xylosyltransferase 1-like [Melitaea cinxia]